MSDIPDFTATPREIQLEPLPEKMPGPGSSQAEFDKFWATFRVANDRRFAQILKLIREKTS